jgi:dTMP kinase
MSAARGLFVTLEGGEGAGKSTLAQALEARLRALDRAVVRTREPGGTPGADAIRTLIVSGAQDRWAPEVETLLLAAARRDHAERTIRPALDQGAVVICDRYQDSTEAYQGAGRGVDGAFLAQAAALIAAPKPDLTFMLDLPVEIGLARSRGAARGEDRFERMDQAFHERVRLAFLAIAAREPGRCHVLDALNAPDALADAAFNVLCERLPAL